MGLLDKMLLSCSNVFFVRPPRRTNKIFTFLSSAGLFGGFTPPVARHAPVVFFMVSNTTKILHFYLESAR